MEALAGDGELPLGMAFGAVSNLKKVARANEARASSTGRDACPTNNGRMLCGSDSEMSDSHVRIPYVIDNQTYRMADVLGALLREHAARSLDIATAYFTVLGFGLLRRGAARAGNLRLILGAEPASGEQLGLRPDANVVKGLNVANHEALLFEEKSLRVVEDLIAYGRFLHGTLAEQLPGRSDIF